MKLVVAEAFAGSFPAARFTQQQQQQAGADVFEVVAYAGVAKEAASRDKYRAPSADQMGLAPESVLILQPRAVGEQSLPHELAEFVGAQLAAVAAADAAAVVVLGGPPCTAYTGVRSDVYKAHNILAGKEIGSKPRDALTQEQREAKASLKLAEHAAELARADQLVSDFIELFRQIETTCQQYGQPCKIIMENPYSAVKKGLWNRCGGNLPEQVGGALEQPTNSDTVRLYFREKFSLGGYAIY